MFFFPSGVSVERQVLQGCLLGGAVRQSRVGTEPDVPVPRKMSSISGLGLFSVDAELEISSELATFPFVHGVWVSEVARIISSVGYEPLSSVFCLVGFLIP